MVSRCIVLFVALGLVQAVLPQGNLFAQNLADVIEECDKSVVKIKVTGVLADSIGSGFIVSSSGMLVTNHHVLGGATQATATLVDGRSFKITGTYYVDESRDVCIAQLDGDDFTAIELSDVLPRKGETVIALGAPVGLDFTATTGIVSANRKGSSLSSRFDGDWIQVDAALSPGNSGGPLVNMEGVVIGMSTLASRGDAQNLNFGVSSGDVLDAIDKAKVKSLTQFRSALAGSRSFGSKSRGGRSVGGRGGMRRGGSRGDSRGGSRGGSRDGDHDDNFRTAPVLPTSRPKIPEDKITRYVESCVAQYSLLREETYERARRRERRCRMMLRGKVKPVLNGEMQFLGTTDRPSRVIYATEFVREREIRKAKIELLAIEKFKAEVGEECTETSLLSLLKFSGPPVDIRKNGDVGLLSNFGVWKVPNDNLAVGSIAYAGIRLSAKNPLDGSVVVWMSSTDDISTESVAPAMTVFVLSTLEIELPRRNRSRYGYGVRREPLEEAKISPAILVTVEESELLEAIQGMDLKKAAIKRAERLWTAGKHTVMASVVSWDDETVTLKKEDGRLKTVMRAILSDADNEFLDGLK